MSKELKPFNLAQALEGKKVVTREGVVVKNITICKHPIYSVSGHFAGEEKETLWTKDGYFYVNFDDLDKNLFMAE